MPTKEATRETEQQETLAYLRKIVTPGDTVYTILRHRSNSGMQRVVDVAVPVLEDGRPRVRTIGVSVAAAIGARYNDRHNGVTVNGCGMDAGFSVVYELGDALWPDGWECLGKHCPSNDHHNAQFFAGHGEPVPTHHATGGYALRHEWL